MKTVPFTEIDSTVNFTVPSPKKNVKLGQRVL